MRKHPSIAAARHRGQEVDVLEQAALGQHLRRRRGRTSPSGCRRRTARDRPHSCRSGAGCADFFARAALDLLPLRGVDRHRPSGRMRDPDGNAEATYPRPRRSRRPGRVWSLGWNRAVGHLVQLAGELRAAFPAPPPAARNSLAPSRETSRPSLGPMPFRGHRAQIEVEHLS